MRINTNVSAIDAYRNLSKVQGDVAGSMQKLSSGFRINKAADDAAGLGIANKLRADTKALTQAQKNAEQANSLLQVAEGGLGTVSKILERMKELATQAASDNTDTAGRNRIQTEFAALRNEITSITSTTKFQGRNLLDGSFGTSVGIDASSTWDDAGTGLRAVTLGATVAAGTYTIGQAADGEVSLSDGDVTVTLTGVGDGAQTLNFAQFGISIETDSAFVAAESDDETADGATIVLAASTTGGGSFMVRSSGAYAGEDNITLSTVDVRVATLGINADSLTTVGGARTALGNIDTAIGRVNTALGEVGAAQNRIGYAIDSAKAQIANFSAAESVIRDVDMAEEMTKFSKNQILAQAGTAMLAQANQSAQGVLQLLRG